MGQKERVKRAKLAAAESDAPPSKAVAKRPAWGREAEAAQPATIEEYTEGVGGECGARPYRSRFLIEATDLEGKLCCDRDWEGRLYGRCYECCRGRGEYAGPNDIYDDLRTYCFRTC